MHYQTYNIQSTANSKDISRASTSIVVKITKSITSDELGADGIDIEETVTINKIVTNVLYVNVTPFKREINIAEIARNKAVPFVLRFTPRVRTNFEMRLSFFILMFMQFNVVGNATALQKYIKYQRENYAKSMIFLRRRRCKSRDPRINKVHQKSIGLFS